MKIGFVWTDFQRRALSAIERVIEGHGRSISVVEAGEKELYLEGTVDSDALKFWVYEDELELKGEKLHLLLERPDFSDLDEMLEYFVAQLTELLERA